MRIGILGATGMLGHHAALANAFPQVHHGPGLLGTHRGFGFLSPDDEEVLLAHGCRVLHTKIQQIEHLNLPGSPVGATDPGPDPPQGRRDILMRHYEVVRSASCVPRGQAPSSR